MNSMTTACGMSGTVTFHWNLEQLCALPHSHVAGEKQTVLI